MIDSTAASAAAQKRLVFLQPMWKLRQESRDLVGNPPEGYRFALADGASEGIVQLASRSDLGYRALAMAQAMLPINLAKAYYESRRPIPADTRLVYGVLSPVTRKVPWILDMQAEQPHLLAGGERVFSVWRRLVRRLFQSEWFRLGLFGLEASKRAFINALDWPEGEEKTRVIYPAVDAKAFARPAHSDKVRLLFVNSGNITSQSHFYSRGGPVLLEVFRRLRSTYPHLELTVRSSLPDEIKKRWQGMPGLRIIDHVIPWPEMEREFINADIFVCPAHLTPYMVFPDAMSYGLPVITTDVWGNPELVDNGRTGLLVHHPQAHEFIDERSIVHYDSPAWRRNTQNVSPELVQGFVEAIASLIETPERRRQMGVAARAEVEDGRFSMKRRMSRLKELLDEALAESPATPALARA